jgi:pimeloyl-ACP methyl ester carboxylesterase
MSANAIPLLFIHGWPDTFIAVANTIDALCNPPTGEEDSPAFHVIVPSIPGFGFSDQVVEDGNNFVTTAEMFDALMKSLGYGQYMLHGSGWWVSYRTSMCMATDILSRGFRVARWLALTHNESCIGIHTANVEKLAPRLVILTIPRIQSYKLNSVLATPCRCQRLVSPMLRL